MQPLVPFVGVSPFNGKVTTIDVLKTITLATVGTPLAPSSMTLTGVTESFGAAAPEPSTWVLLSTSLLLILIKKARIRSV